MGNLGEEGNWGRGSLGQGAIWGTFGFLIHRRPLAAFGVGRNCLLWVVFYIGLFWFFDE